MDILYQIRARQDSFSAGEGRIARLMLDDVGFAASASLDELALRAEVSSATLSRFARTVGCKDLRDLRLQLAQASGVGSRFLDPAGAPEQSGFYRQILGDMHVHGEILPTPDSAPGKDGAKSEDRAVELFRDNVVYMDKLVGQLVAELERLKLRDNTLIVFMGDNGTAKPQADRATIGGKRLEGEIALPLGERLVDERTGAESGLRAGI